LGVVTNGRQLSTRLTKWLQESLAGIVGNNGYKDVCV
jgi:hypothetical protein